MIVFDLQCDSAHGFEVWFASSAAYDAQHDARQLVCPYCGSTDVAKAAMAPRVAARSPEADAKPPLAKLAALQRQMLEGSAWVGSAFPAQARSMAAGAMAPATIHGTATPAEVQSLHDDGVGVMPLPFPVVPPDKRN